MTQAITLRIPTGFAKERADLIRRMEAEGWTGRITTNGHAFMRAPDGETTCSVAPKLGSPTRATGNSEAVFKRWLKQQEQAIQPAIQAPALEPVLSPQPLVDTATKPEICQDCERTFGSLQALSVHHVRAHVRVACPVCELVFSPSNLPRHQNKHREELTEETLAELYRARRETARLRVEIAGWQTLAEEAEASYAALQERARQAATLLGG